MKSVYIHIPFCKNICSYCDFCKMIYNKEFVNSYLEELSKEINERYEDDILDTIYIGGGTPSSLDKDDLKILFDIIKTLKTSNNLEFTFECNLDDINESLLTILKENKVNRLSIGIQSFDKDNLKFMNRFHTFKEANEKVELCKKLGFNNINVDLIYGIPEEKFLTLKKDLKYMIKLDVTHISTYSLIIEDHTKIKINNIIPISDETDAKMYEYICNKLKKKGYYHYEVSNFSRHGYESRHNINYWNNEEYYGFGLGAHGYILGFRYENTRSLTDYLEGYYKLNESIVSIQEDFENEIMLGLRKLKGIDLEKIKTKFELDLLENKTILSLIKSNYLVLKDNFLSIPENKIYLMNEILLKIL